MSILPSLAQVRDMLISLEDTIILAIIKRAHFKQNRKVYEAPSTIGVAGNFEYLNEHSLLNYTLWETEKLHSKMARYTSPEHQPFFEDLPPPLIAIPPKTTSPMLVNMVNMNSELKELYVTSIVNQICHEGDDGQYFMSSLHDVSLLQSLSLRAHHGALVGEIKYMENPDSYKKMILSKDADGLLQKITFPSVEQEVLARIFEKALHYTKHLYCADHSKVLANAIVSIYESILIPMTKKTQVAYLLKKL